MDMIEIRSHTAALALHRSLLGVTQLHAAEKAAIGREFGHFRTAKAILTYYAVYHLVTACMVCSEDEKVKALINEKKPFDNGEKGVYISSGDGYVGVVAAEQIKPTDKLTEDCDGGSFNPKRELPEDWEDAGRFERDLSIIINHWQARKYCGILRERKKSGDPLPRYEELLYQAFADDRLDAGGRCIPGLYEKLNYIRDRSVYRPSFVIDSDGKTWQTSWDIKREIDSLPDPYGLYENIKAVILGLLEPWGEVVEPFSLLWWVLYNFAVPNCGRKVSELLVEGYTSEELNRLTSECGDAAKWDDESGTSLTVSQHISQLLELEDVDTAIAWHKAYWQPLFGVILDKLFPQRMRKV